jgi:hypothetical protein
MNKRQKRSFTDSEWLQHTAVHEAGHAVMAVHLDSRLAQFQSEQVIFMPESRMHRRLSQPHFMSLGEQHNAGLKFRSTNTAISRNQKGLSVFRGSVALTALNL